MFNFLNINPLPAELGLSVGVIILIAALGVVFFILGNVLIIKGVKSQSPIFIILGIFLTGLIWGVVVWLIASSTLKPSRSNRRR